MSVTKFLEDHSHPEWNGGAPCRTCRHPRRKAIDLACREFMQARADGKTYMPWSTFVHGYLRKEFKYTLGERSLRNHAEKHLGTKK